MEKKQLFSDQFFDFFISESQFYVMVYVILIVNNFCDFSVVATGT